MQVRHYLPAFHEIIDRGVAAHEFRFGPLATTGSRRGSLAFSVAPRKGSALNSPIRRITARPRRKSIVEPIGSSKDTGSRAGEQLMQSSLSEKLQQVQSSSLEQMRQLPGVKDLDWQLAFLGTTVGSDPQWTFASASLEISSSPHSHV